MILTKFKSAAEDHRIQQAESEKYGFGPRWIHRLDNKQIAVYSSVRELVAIVDTLDEIFEVDLHTASQLQKDIRKHKFDNIGHRATKIKRVRKEPENRTIQSKALDDLESFFK